MQSDVNREELHFRRIDLRAWRRSDGLFEVEGHLTDRKPEDFVPANGGHLIPAHEPIHDMGVRLIYDEALTVQAVTTFSVAFPYAQCPQGGRGLQAMVGVRMTSGWSREVRERLAGARSCTHLRELLVPMATVAFQSLSLARRARPDPLDANGRPKKIDSCYAYGAGRELVRRLWPEHYRPEPGDQSDTSASAALPPASGRPSSS